MKYVTSVSVKNMDRPIERAARAMRAMKAAPRLSVAAVLATGLVACGGGGGGGGPVQQPPALVSIGGTITGLAGGKNISLVLDGAESQTFAQLNATGFEFIFARELSRGAAYNVSIGLNPLNQLCELSSGSGTADANVRNISIVCRDTLLNDTGVSTGQDGASGRDAAAAAGILAKVGAGRAGFDFSRICGSGEVAGSGSCPSSPIRGAGVNEWACTLDNVSGAIWQVRTEGADHPWSEVGQPATAANAAMLCGRDDWRLPTPVELAGIVDSGAAAAVSIDTGFFPDTAAVSYWTSTEVVQDPESSWVVEFDNGAVGIANQANPARVRLLSAEQIEADFSFEATNVLVDGRTGLMWLSTSQTGSWQAAQEAAAGVNASSPGGHSDWRLPNRNELGSLVDRLQRGPAADADVVAGFDPALAASGYWTSSAFSGAADTPANAWVVDFGEGDILPRGVGNSRRIMLVRNRTHGI